MVRNCQLKHKIEQIANDMEKIIIHRKKCHFFVLTISNERCGEKNEKKMSYNFCAIQIHAAAPSPNPMNGF